MRIRRVDKKLILDQQDYLKKIVTRFGLDDAKLLSLLYLNAMNLKRIKEPVPLNSDSSINLLSDLYCT